MLNAGNYRPPRWLRNPHLQSLLGSSPLRRRRGAQALAATGATNTSHIVDGGNGVRLQGLHSTMPGTTPRALALLLHGWEGSAESSYMQLTAAQLLARGFDVFRLNFRDHGDTHHLNEEVFHSNRIDEVVQAACDVAGRFPARPLVVAGYSLGGNFALRLGLRAPAAGLPLLHVAAVCPVLDPARTMAVMESGLALYHRYFQHKWTRSLRRKRELFPQRNVFDDRTLALGMRGLTRWLVEQYTDFENLDGYFDGYAIVGRSPVEVDDPGQPADQRRRPDHPGRRFPRAAIAGLGDAGHRRARRPLRVPREPSLRWFWRTLGRRTPGCRGDPCGCGACRRRARVRRIGGTIGADPWLKRWTMPMKLWSDSFEHRGRIPAEFAMGTPEGFGGNRNPHLAWDGAPQGTRSFALLCIDTDAPTDASLAGRDDVEIPVAHPRGEFVHWVLVDLPATTHAHRCRQLQRRDQQARQAGRQPAREGTRQGLNDYTGWFAGDADMGGRLLRLRRAVSAAERPAPAPLFLPPVRARCRTARPAGTLHRRRCVPCDARARAGRDRDPRHLFAASAG